MEGLWKICVQIGDKQYNKYVLVEESSAEVFGHPSHNHLVRAWIRDEQGFYEISLAEHKTHIDKIKDRLFPFIQMSFYIFPDRQHVIIGSQEANTAGSGGQYIVEGHGITAKLVQDPHGGFWIS